MRRLYSDMSPGYAWDGREPEALEVATATQLTTRTVASFLTTGTDALAATPRPLAFLVGGATPAHAPTTATVTATDENDESFVEVVSLHVTSAGARRAGAACMTRAVKTLTSVVYSAGSGTGATVAIGFGLAPGVADLRVIPIETWLEAFPDRRRAGYLDVAVMNEIIRPASTKVDGALATPNGNYDVPFSLAHLGDIGRITRDFCLATAGKLRPTVFVVDHVSLQKDAQADLDRLRKALASVGETPPDHAKNVGGAVGAIGDNAPYAPPQSFTSNLGDFA